MVMSSRSSSSEALKQSSGHVTGKLKSLYMPDSCIQGDEFPAHVIWDKSTKLRVRVKCPSSIRIKEVYNVPENEKSVQENDTTEYHDFSVNGYVGFVFRTQPLGSAFVREEVSFRIESLEDGSSEQFSKQIYLFRPSIELVKAPKELRVKYDANKGSWSTSDKIRIRNTGAGTAIVEVSPIPQGEFELGSPPNVDEFQASFTRDFATKLSSLSTEYPRFSDVLNELLSLFREPVPFLDEEGKKKIKSAFDHLVAAMRDDSGFVEAFASAVVTSYLKNVQLITELASFREYLNSIGEGRVIILNSVASVKAKKPRAKLQIVIRVTDLANNDYPSLELPPINVNWEGEGGIPVHMLFDWKTGITGEKRIG